MAKECVFFITNLETARGVLLVQHYLSWVSIGSVGGSRRTLCSCMSRMERPTFVFYSDRVLQHMRPAAAHVRWRTLCVSSIRLRSIATKVANRCGHSSTTSNELHAVRLRWTPCRRTISRERPTSVLRSDRVLPEHASEAEHHVQGLTFDFEQ